MIERRDVKAAKSERRLANFEYFFLGVFSTIALALFFIRVII